MAEQKPPLENLMIMSQRLDQLDGQFDWSDEIQQIRAALSHAEGEAPAAYMYRFADPISGHPVWRFDPGTWNGQKPKESKPLYTHPAPQVAGWRSGYPEYDGDGGVCHIPLDGHPDFMVVAFNRDGALVDSCGDDVGYGLEDVERWQPIGAHPAPQVAVPEAVKERVVEAIAEARGDAKDCIRVWTAWGVGTMGPDDFLDVAGDPDRLDEIAEAAITAMFTAAPTAPAGESDDSDICERVELPPWQREGRNDRT